MDEKESLLHFTMGQAGRPAPEMTAAWQANLELSGPISFIFMRLAWKDLNQESPHRDVNSL